MKILVMVHALVAQTWNVDFIKTGFNGQMYLIIVWHSAANSGVLSNNQFPSKLTL